MRKIFNKIFRYRLVSIYFILSQLVILIRLIKLMQKKMTGLRLWLRIG